MGKGKSGSSGGADGKPNPNFPSTTGKKSGGGRGNMPKTGQRVGTNTGTRSGTRSGKK